MVMRILGIETSCDETGISILDFKNNQCKILANLVYSQIKVHQPYGGVVPNLAKREHQKNLIPMLRLALQEARCTKKKKNQFSDSQTKILEKILLKDEVLKQNLLPFLQTTTKPKIDFIAVTKGPGLAPALWPGVNLARALSFYWRIPLLGINHLEGHILSNWLPKEENQWASLKIPQSLFPAAGLIISGGHTQLILIKKIGQYRLVGETRDDAAGECFDKTARLLGLSYPGGPAIAAEAKKIKNLPPPPLPIHLPRPMIDQKNYDFSFAGLKTAVLYLVEDLKKQGISLNLVRPFLAAEIQNSINEVLVSKTIRLAKNFRTQSIIAAGGVAANEALTQLLQQEATKKLHDIQVLIPEKQYTGDNAAMIALAAYFHRQRPTSWQQLEANPNLRL